MSESDGIGFKDGTLENIRITILQSVV